MYRFVSGPSYDRFCGGRLNLESGSSSNIAVYSKVNSQIKVLQVNWEKNRAKMWVRVEFDNFAGSGRVGLAKMRVSCKLTNLLCIEKK